MQFLVAFNLCEIKPRSRRIGCLCEQHVRNAMFQVGMRHYHKTKNNLHCPIVNLDKIWSLVGEEVSHPREQTQQTA